MKTIINLCPTGMIPTKAMTPYVPLQPEEIIKDVVGCHKIGITMTHLHARDIDGKPTWKPDVYHMIIAGIKAYCPDLVICVSTSGRTFPDFDQRAAILDLGGYVKPDMASLTLSSLNFNRVASMNSPDMIMKLLDKMHEKGIKPELEVFDLGMINYAKYLIHKGLLTPSPSVTARWWA